METFGDLYDQLLDEGGPVRIGILEYLPSRVLREVDPIAYRVGFGDWMDGLECRTCGASLSDHGEEDEATDACSTCEGA